LLYSRCRVYVVFVVVVVVVVLCNANGTGTRDCVCVCACQRVISPNLILTSISFTHTCNRSNDRGKIISIVQQQQQQQQQLPLLLSFVRITRKRRCRRFGNKKKSFLAEQRCSDCNSQL